MAFAVVLAVAALAAFRLAATAGDNLPLVIAPALNYSTYLGGSGFDAVTGVAVDSVGSVYVTGYTNSPDFPVRSGAQSALGGGTCGSGLDTYACFDAFVAKIDPSGIRLVYATYLGGSGEDYGAAIAVDDSGAAYITGYTNSPDFPVVNTIQATAGGGTCGAARCFDAFAAKLDATGASIVYSTYLGGSADDYGQGIAVDADGDAMVSGFTASSDFPLRNAILTRFGGGTYDGFVAKLDPQGTAFTYSTYLGGSGDDFGTRIAADAAGNAYATGYTNSQDFPTLQALQPNSAGGTCGASVSTSPCFDAYVVKLGQEGSMVYSTYLGGSGGDYGYGIAVDSCASAYVTGQTTSVDYPVGSGALQASGGGRSTDAFLTKLSPDGASAVYSTYLGGAGAEAGLDVAVDSAGRAYVAGYTYGSGFPLAKPVQGASGGFFDAFLARLGIAGEALEFSTYLGGSGNEEARAVAVDARGNAYLGGETFSTDFPVASATVQPAYGGGSYDGFVTKVSIEPPPVLRLSAAKLAFADQGIGTTSAPQTITLKNVGEALVALGKPSISGDFTVANECGTTLAPGSDCALEVTFAPAVPGARTGELTIPSDADGAPHAVELAGNGIGPAMDLSASAIVFEGMVVGATSAPRAVTLANSGNAPLSLSGIATSGDFAEANNCESGLPAGASCTIHITFAPTTAGTRSGALTVTNSFPHDVQAVSLSGIGQDFSVSASPDKAEIAAGKSGSYTLTVVPAGGFAKTVALACSGAPRAASCAVLPSSLILDGTNAAQATVTFETAAGGAAAPEEGSRPGSMRPHRKLPPYWLVLAALLFAFSAASGARRRLRWARAGVAVATLTVLLWSACGGGGGVPPAPPPPAGTPAGTYTLTLTGTYGSLTHSVNVAVTVK